MVHVANKGKEGEREVCRLLNAEINAIIAANTLDQATIDMLKAVVQRNQNQSAVGGGDINLFGLSIEVKRQETLSVEEWWRQTTKSAERNGDKPVLIYRQNNKKWHVVIDGWLPLPHDFHSARTTINLESFQAWFRRWVEHKVKSGALARV
jgi:Holliday junction resolvase